MTALTPARAAEVPRTIAFQGVLKDAGGKPVTTMKSVTFTLYDAATEGNAVWTETKDITPDASGVFATLLGSATPLTTVVFDKAYWVGAKVGADAEMTPRLPLQSVPYALALSGIVIDSAGQVGIRTELPRQTLDIAGNCLANEFQLRYDDPNVRTGFILMGLPPNASGSTNGWKILGRPSYPDGSGNGPDKSILQWDNRYPSDSGDLVLVPDGGNVRIGSFTPGHRKLAIIGPNSPETYEGTYQDISFEFGSAGSAKIRSFRGGSWDTYLQFYTTRYNEGSDNPRRVLELGQDGNAYFDGSIFCKTLTLTSSRRYKANVRPISSALNTIARLQGVSYTWDDKHGGRKDIGFIAEDVAKVIPELVTMEPDGVNAQGMDYAHLTALLVEGIKELKAENDAKDAQLAEQSQQINDLTARLARLEQKEAK